MATSDVSKKVLRLKLKLTESTESKTVLETLNKLQELDITIDVLAETGIGKAVNSFRKHGDAGEVAKSLVRHWKKLVPKESQSHTEDGATSQTKHFKTAKSQINSAEGCVKTEDHNELDLKQKCSEMDDKDYVTYEDQLKPEEKKKDLLARDEPQEIDRKLEAEKKGKEEMERNKKKGEERKREREEIKAEVEKMDVSQENERKSPELKKHFKCERERRENLNKKVERREKKGYVPLKMHHNHGMDSENDDFLQSKNDHKKSRPVSNEGPKTNSDICKGNGTKRVSGKKPQSCPTSFSRETKSECDGNRTLFNIDSLQVNKKAENEAALLAGVHKRGPCEGKQKCIKTKDQTAHKKNSKNLKSTKVFNDTEKDLELPSMSFESCLSYDFKAPKRKKRSGHSEKPAKKHNTCEKEEGPVKGKTGSVMDLLNVPLPAFLPECDELSNFQYITVKEEERTSRASDVPQEATIFTGQRLNKKMQVYSGVKTTFLPSMMTLYQQCIRALQNNIDLLYEIGGVPFEILQPVLERCTPYQLQRIEECNPVYVGLTELLWERHCRRDFRNAQLEEYESWREMHLRLSEERERKLQQLTKTIVSAHSGKPKGRQVKLAFINSIAKPPRNVRIQQEIYGTAHPLQQPHPLDRPRSCSYDGEILESL
ncbi:elongin A, like isoform X2 [Osmerus eperlanus]|uniref:elongin A, like isoform X2 n=1 Tax=Osmerus eperlanus TaxID=29151 RepID=UPI002E15851A